LPFCLCCETLLHCSYELLRALPGAEDVFNRFNSTRGWTLPIQIGRATNVLFDVLSARAGRGDQAEDDGLANKTVLISARQFSTHFPVGVSAILLLRGAESVEASSPQSCAAVYATLAASKCALSTCPEDS